jgi:TolB-like protein/DNA-binding winged helix-turn-helix (wHTH) protein/Tfp pilus assembly protein PilF
MERPNSTLFMIGDWRVEPSSGRLERDGVAVALEPRTLRLLLSLAARPGQVVSVQTLLDEVWTDVVVTPDSVYQAIASLRRTLGDNAKDSTYITTVSRRGYRLAAEVRPVATAVTTADSATPEGGPATAQIPKPATTPPRTRWPVVTVLATASLAIGLLIGISTGAIGPRPASAPTAARPLSVAVLPFIDLSEARDQGFFADGLSEELIDHLARMPNLYVPARTSSFYFKDRRVTIDVVARQLRVTHVLEGSIRKSGDHIRITAQLIRADTGYHVWSETYDRPVQEIFAAQDDIANAVVRTLKGSLLPDRPAATHLPTPAAYESYLKVRQAFERGNSDDAAYLEQLTLLDQALAIDPSFARAHALKASVLVARAGFDYMPAADGFEAARKAASRAIELDSSEASGHTALAKIHMLYDWDAAQAKREIDAALALDLSDSSTLRVAGQIAETLGQNDEAIRYYEQATRKDPLAAFTFYDLGSAFHTTHRLPEAKAALQRALELGEGSGQALAELGLVDLDQGEYEDALKRFSGADERSGAEGRAMIYFAMGRRGESDAAMRIAERLDRSRDEFSLAEVRAFRGEPDLALAALDRAITRHEIDCIGITTDPYLQSLRNDGRFLALVARVSPSRQP